MLKLFNLIADSLFGEWRAGEEEWRVGDNVNSTDKLDINKRWVRVSRVTAAGFVEFAFFVADKDLCTELILPMAAFKEFCRNNKVSVATDTLAAMVGAERIARGLQERIH